MYESFFGLNARPFLVAAAADRYFPAAAIEAARQNLLRCVERGEGPAMLIGPTGTGKTMLLSVLAAQSADSMQVAWLSCSRLCSRKALMQAILYELGLNYRQKEEGELRLALIDHLGSDSDRSQPLLLIVEEAHSLPLKLIEEWSVITNLSRQ